MGPTSTPADEESSSSAISSLLAFRSDLSSLLLSSASMDRSLSSIDRRLSLSLETLAAASDAVDPLTSQFLSAKSLHSRINRAVSPALSLLQTLSLAESLNRRRLHLSIKSGTTGLLKYVDCVDRLSLAVGSVTAGCQPAVQRLQEAVEFLSRTKATDQFRIHRLRETMAALKVLYEGEVDEALLRLQDEYEAMLQRIRHEGVGIDDGRDLVSGEIEGSDETHLGSDLVIEMLRRISETISRMRILPLEPTTPTRLRSPRVEATRAQATTPASST